MALIKDRKPAVDNWLLLEPSADGAFPAVPESGDVIVPLAIWKTARDQLLARGGRIGVWLAANDEPADIAADLDRVDLIAVRFEKFSDGRGYSIARIVRERYGWRGELRAFGDIQRDQVYYLTRCGFDALSLRQGEDVDTALAAFGDFSEAYQTAVDRSVPLFRRRDDAAAPQ
jgi:uncharacterized protein (DUF934 family)